MSRLSIYTKIYIYAGMPLFVLSLIWPILTTPFALVYFGVTALMVFTNEPLPEPDPSHSSTTQYEQVSRFNWFNYAVAIYIAFSSMLFVLLPINKSVIILIMWGAIAYVLERYGGRAIQVLAADYLTTYLKQQIPELSYSDVRRAVNYLLNNPLAQPAALAKDLGLTTQQATKAHHFFNVYIQNNSVPRQ